MNCVSLLGRRRFGKLQNPLTARSSLDRSITLAKVEQIRCIAFVIRKETTTGVEEELLIHSYCRHDGSTTIEPLQLLSWCASSDSIGNSTPSSEDRRCRQLDSTSLVVSGPPYGA
jgi:hypothetical protein